MALRWVPNYWDPDTGSLCRTPIHHCNYALVSMQAGARSKRGVRAARGGSPPSGECDVWRQHRGGRYLYLMSDVVCFLFFCTTRETLKLKLNSALSRCQTHYGKALFINASLGGNSAEIFFRLLFSSFLWESARFWFQCLTSRWCWIVRGRKNGGAAYFLILPLRFNEVRTKF